MFIKVSRYESKSRPKDATQAFFYSIQNHAIRLKVKTFLSVVIELLPNIVFSEETLHKICQNTDFLVPRFSRKKTESTTMSFWYLYC